MLKQILFSGLLCSGFFYTATAQFTCCDPSTVAPEITAGMNGTPIDINGTTPAPTLSVTASSNLPNVEFLITKRGTAALFNDGSGPDTTGGGGDVIIGGDADGIITPADLGRYGVTLADNDTFDLTAIGFDLPVMQNLTDSLLNGSAPNGSSLDPCCNLFFFMSIGLGQPAVAGFCDSVNNAGINSGADVLGIEQILDIIDAFSTGEASVESMISTMGIINSNGNSISVDCGGTGTQNFVAYGINNAAQYSYVVNDPLSVQNISSVARFVVFPNPAQQSAQLNITTDVAVSMHLNIINSLGQTVYASSLGVVEGNFSKQIPLESMAQGLYTLVLSDGKQQTTTLLEVH